MENKNHEVYNAIISVMDEIGAISKSRKNAQQGYMFRGIDDVLTALQPCLIKHGLVIKPKVEDLAITEHQSKSGGTLFRVIAKVEYTMISVKDGSSLTTTFYGEAMDSGDKATNKAMSTAYKYFCFQQFCIPTDEQKDTENETHEVKPSGHSQPSQPVTPNANDDDREWLNLTTKTGAPTQKGETAKKFIATGGSLADILKKYKVNKADLAILQAMERHAQSQEEVQDGI
jgi:hypothetical protein